MVSRPNVLVLMVDCLRADQVFGSQRGCRTPFLDEWQRRGVSFTQCISTATTTTPSTAALLTGQWPVFNGVRSHSGYKLNPASVTVAQYLKSAGYRTLARVTGPLSLEVGLDRGFDDYQWRHRREYVFGPWGERLLGELRELARCRQPWLLWLHLFELHKPRQVLPEFDREEFGRNYYERSLSSLDGALRRIIEAAGPQTLVVLTGDHGERLLATVAEDRRYDFWRPVWKPFLKLRKRLFALRADPVSETFYETGHGFHVFDELVRVPLVIVGPGLPAATTVPHQVRHVDLMPTLLELAGVSPADLNVQGRSLLPLIRGEESADRPAYCEAVGAALPNEASWLAAIRVPPYKYCYRPFAAKPHEELYDLQSDPAEKRNRAAEQPQRCADLKAQLQALSREFAAQPILQGQRMSEEEQKVLEGRLRDLGYIE